MKLLICKPHIKWYRTKNKKIFGSSRHILPWGRSLTQKHVMTAFSEEIHSSS